MSIQRPEPLTEEELGEFANWLGCKIYGIIRREDIDEDILKSMQLSNEARALRLRKSRRWILPNGFPQLGWFWRAILDLGPFKSEWNGKHDLDGGKQCLICHTWHRYGHVLSHPHWDDYIIVGCDCAAMLGDTDPTWTEKKLQQLVLERQNRLERERQQAQREREDNLRCRVLAKIKRERLLACPPITMEENLIVDSIEDIELDSLPFTRFRQPRQFEQAQCPIKWIENDRGNYVYHGKILGEDVISTVFKHKSGNWKYVLNLCFDSGMKTVFSDIVFFDSNEAMLKAIDAAKDLIQLHKEAVVLLRGD